MTNEPVENLNDGDAPSGVDFGSWFAENGMSLRAGDMFVVGDARTLSRLAELTALLAISSDGDGQTPISSVLVICPPSQLSAQDKDSQIHEAVGKAILRLRDSPVTMAEEAALSRRVRIVTSPTYI